MTLVTPLVAHDRHRRPKQSEGSTEVHVDDGVEVLVRGLQQRRHLVDAGVVDEDVQGAEVLDRRADHVLGRGGGRQVDRQPCGPVPRRIGDLEHGAGGVVDQEHPGSLAQQLGGDGPAQAPGGAGDDCDGVMLHGGVRSG